MNGALMSINKITSISNFKLEDTPKNSIRHYWLSLISNALGEPVRLPVMVARGRFDGPVVGLTAAVHGNELNGISVIQRLFADLEVDNMKGSVVAVPVVNINAFKSGERVFNDGQDLNRIMPGKANGNISEIYAYRFINLIVKKLDYLLDLHTASFGRVNSFYIRSDMSNTITSTLALLQDADIILHSPPSDGTLRGAAEALNIPAITIEVGNPNQFQKKLIRSGLEGVHNVLSHLEVIPDQIESMSKDTVMCSHSYWIYTEQGGLLTVHVELKEKIKKGDHIATLKNIFGKIIQKHYAPEDGIIIGKSTNPVNQSGGRIIHLGIIK